MTDHPSWRTLLGRLWREEPLGIEWPEWSRWLALGIALLVLLAEALLMRHLNPPTPAPFMRA